AANGTTFSGSGRGASYGSKNGASRKKLNVGMDASRLSSHVQPAAESANVATKARPNARRAARGVVTERATDSPRRLSRLTAKSKGATAHLLRPLPYLLRAALPQDPGRLGDPCVRRGDEDPEPPRGERRVVDDVPARARQPRVDEQADHRGERAEQDGQLEC